MNFHRLTKLYDQLTPTERLPLIIAARARGDAVEQARLVESAPLQKLAELASYHAARFVAHFDGWKQFCLAMHMDPEVVLNLMPGRDIIMETEKQARYVAFSHEEAGQFLRRLTVAVEGKDSLGPGPAPLETADELAKGWRETVDELARKW
jgi:hypothetical protein